MHYGVCAKYSILPPTDIKTAILRHTRRVVLGYLAKPQLTCVLTTKFIMEEKSVFLSQSCVVCSTRAAQLQNYPQLVPIQIHAGYQSGGNTPPVQNTSVKSLPLPENRRLKFAISIVRSRQILLEGQSVKANNSLKTTKRHFLRFFNRFFLT